VVLAIGSACKLVAPYLLAVLVLLELGRILIWTRGRAARNDWTVAPALRRLFICGFSAAGIFMAILGVMDQIATPYNDAAAQLITGGAFAHFSHMVSYADTLVSPRGPQGIASYPWDWLVDLKPITYLRINPSLPGDGLFAIHPVSKFLGFISPPVLAAGVIALPIAAWRFLRLPRVQTTGFPGSETRPRITGDTPLALVGLAWFLGTWIPFALLSLVDQRTSYLYYMVVVMPGLYVIAAWLASLAWRLKRRWSRGLVIVWGLTVIASVVLLYPFTPVF
jgi:hypothetical protein